MHLNRRAFTSAALTLPFLPRCANALDLMEMPLLPLKGVHALSASPDGSRLAGLDEQGGVGIWDIETSETLALVPPTPVTRGIDPTSIAWAPDGSSFAFSILAFELGSAGRVYQVTVDSGELTALTGAPNADLTVDETGNQEIDTMPCWSATGDELHFVRSTRKDGMNATSIMTMWPETGDITEFAVVDTRESGAILDPLWRYRDGSILFNHNRADGISQLRRVAAGGTPEPLEVTTLSSDDGEKHPMRVQGYGSDASRMLCERSGSSPSATYWLLEPGSDPNWTRLSTLIFDEPLLAAPALNREDGQFALLYGSPAALWVFEDPDKDPLPAGHLLQLRPQDREHGVRCFWGGPVLFAAAGTKMWRWTPGR